MWGENYVPHVGVNAEEHSFQENLCNKNHIKKYS